jgi:hypothetical protein
LFPDFEPRERWKMHPRYALVAAAAAAASLAFATPASADVKAKCQRNDTKYPDAVEISCLIRRAESFTIHIHTPDRPAVALGVICGTVTIHGALGVPNHDDWMTFSKRTSPQVYGLIHISPSCKVMVVARSPVKGRQPRVTITVTYVQRSKPKSPGAA